MLLRARRLMEMIVRARCSQVRRVRACAGEGESFLAADAGSVAVAACTALFLVRGGGFGEELLEVFEEVGRCLEETGYLCVDVLDGLAFALVGLQDLEELLVDVWLLGEAILDVHHALIFKFLCA